MRSLPSGARSPATAAQTCSDARRRYLGIRDSAKTLLEAVGSAVAWHDDGATYSQRWSRGNTTRRCTGIHHRSRGNRSRLQLYWTAIARPFARWLMTQLVGCMRQNGLDPCAPISTVATLPGATLRTAPCRPLPSRNDTCRSRYSSSMVVAAGGHANGQVRKVGQSTGQWCRLLNFGNTQEASAAAWTANSARS